MYGLFSIGSKIIPFEMIEHFLPSYRYFFSFKSTDFGSPEFSASVRKLEKIEKKPYGCPWRQQEFSGSSEFLEYLILNEFSFSNNSA